MGHRGTLKKDHKPFKSKHATKGQLKNMNKGKVEKTSSSISKKGVLNKHDKKNHMNQIKSNKMIESTLIRKLFEGVNGVEKIVTVISLTEDISASTIINALIQSTVSSFHDFAQPSVTNLKIDRFKSNLKIIIPDNNLVSILDATKVSDFTVLGLSATTEVDQYGESILRAIIAQGISSVVGVVANLVSAFSKRNLQLDVRKSLTSYFTHFFPNEDKLFALEIESEYLNCIRHICQKVPKSVGWRDSRGYMVTDKISVEGDRGMILVEGTVRGIGFNCENLVHIPEFGDFQISHIERWSKLKDSMNDIYEAKDPETLEELNPVLDFEMDDNEMDDEMANYSHGIRMDGKTYFQVEDNDTKRKYKVPKGTSDYQSKWLLDDVLEGVSDVEDEDDHLPPMAEDAPDIKEGIVVDDLEDNGDDEMFVELSPEEEQQQLKSYRSQIKDDIEFPDEIELHPEDSAKEVLAKYRGVKSLGNCQWDVDEYDDTRPNEWNRLLHIKNYKNIKNRITKLATKNAQVTMGDKVKIYIKVPAATLATFTSIDPHVKPFTVYGLLEHEHKLAVTNFSFENWEGLDESLASNAPLIAQYGPRRQIINPLFNQHSNTPNNVHKLEKFHHPGTLSIVTCVAPVLFYQAPMIFFQPQNDGSLKLVGQGTFLNCDDTRIIAERSILTGHPVKIHKRVVTIRYMFFNADDINWFKAVPLYTPLGRAGFIKESLGTHGYFKANFDGKLSAQDVVAMNLYKRVWPQVP